MEKEAKAKVVASVRGGRICSISCRASFLTSLFGRNGWIEPFCLVYLEETVELNRFASVYFEEMVEFNPFASVYSIWKKRLNSIVLPQSIWKKRFNSTVLPRSIWKKRLNSTVSSKSTEAKQLERQEIENILSPNRRDDLCLGFCPHPSSMLATLHQRLWFPIVWEIFNLISIPCWPKRPRTGSDSELFHFQHAGLLPVNIVANIFE